MNDQLLIPFPTILVYQQMKLPHTKFWVVRYRPRNKESSSMTIMMRMFLKKYQCKWRLNCQVKALLIADVQLQLSWIRSTTNTLVSCNKHSTMIKTLLNLTIIFSRTMILSGIIRKFDITYRIIRFGNVPQFVYSKTLLGIKCISSQNLYYVQ